jgi:hypothetical protein
MMRGEKDRYATCNKEKRRKEGEMQKYTKRFNAANIDTKNNARQRQK